MSKSKVPEIRFEGFSGEWEESMFGENLISIQLGTNLLGSLTNDGMPLIKMGNIQRGAFSFKKLEYLDKNVKINKESIVSYGDFLFNTRNTLELVGKGATWMEPSGNYVFNNNIAHFKFKGIDTIFFNYLYNTQNMIKQVQARAMGTTSVAAIYPKNLHSIKYSLPRNTEQTKIGNYFQNLDKLISQKEKKQKTVKQLKKAMLGKMFPKSGKSKPEIRFEGFCGEWVEQKFYEVFKNISNNTLSRAELNYSYGKAKNIHYGDVLIKFGELLDIQKEEVPFITNDNFISKFKSSKLFNGDLIIADAAEDNIVGKCCEIINIKDTTVFSGLHTIAVRPIHNFASKYLGYYINSSSYHNQLLPLLQGTKVLSISKTAIQDTDISFPKDELEQTKIGNYFQKLDKLIELQEKELEKLKNLKKASLDKMFVS